MAALFVFYSCFYFREGLLSASIVAVGVAQDEYIDAEQFHSYF